MKDDNGDPTCAECPTRKALLRKMGKLIPNLTIRKKRLAAIKQHQQKVLKATGGGSGAGADGGAGKKRKGKKKGKKRR